jgi:hypothetical protein
MAIPDAIEIRGIVARIDVSDRYTYSRDASARRKKPNAATIWIQRDDMRDAYDKGENIPEPYEYEIPRELAERMRVGTPVTLTLYLALDPV